MRIKSCFLTVILSTALVLVAAGRVLAESCPYCGRTYGAAAPGDEARVDALRREHERTCPSRPTAHRSPRQSSSGAVPVSYGAVLLRNRTGHAVTYRLRSRRGGSWTAITLQPAGGYYHWQPTPAAFEVRFDRDQQKRKASATQGLQHNLVSGRKPTEEDGREYEFLAAGAWVLLRAARPSLAGFNASVLGRGEGRTHDRKPFGEARKAKGSYEIEVMSGTEGKRTTMRGEWSAERLEDRISPDTTPYRTEVWRFTSKSKRLGTGEATLRGSESGASGTAHGWIISIPGLGDVNVQFQVQFTGDSISLSGFAKVF